MKKLYTAYTEKINRALGLIDFDMLEKIVRAIVETRRGNASVYTMGNGGSGATASHWVCDLNKGASSDGKPRFRVHCLNDNVPTLMAYANDISYEDIFVEPLKNYLREGDVVIGFSGSGHSKNVLKAIGYANDAGALTIGFTGFDGGELAETARMNLNVPMDDIKVVEDVHLILCHIIMHSVTNDTHA